MTSTGDMRHLISLLETKQPQPPSDERLDEWRGWLGGLKGYVQGFQDRRKLFADWKRFRRRYRREGTLADVKDWLKSKGQEIPPEKFDSIVQRARLPSRADVPIEDARLSRLFTELAFLNSTEGDVAPSAARASAPQPRGVRDGHQQQKSRPQDVGPTYRQEPSLPKLSAPAYNRLKTAIAKGVEPRNQEELMKWLEKVPHDSKY